MKLVNYDIFSLIDMAKNGRRIIAFGSGKGFQTFCQTFKCYNIQDYISFVMDNNDLLAGKYCTTNGKQIRIVSTNEVMNSLLVDDVIIITMQYLNEALKQFAGVKDLTACFYGFVLDRFSEWKAETCNTDFKIVCDRRYSIPKIIHYCWFGKGKIPEKNKEWMDSWRRLCPDYEIQEWNEDNYDVYKNKYMAEAYEAKKWGFVPDYARLDIIYKYGGIYLDTDVELIQGLDSLLSQEAFAGFQDELSLNFGQGFGSVPSNPLMKELRDFYENCSFLLEDGTFNMTTSPVFQTELLVSKGLVANGAFQQLPHINIYPRILLSPKNHYNRRVISSDLSYSVHHYDGSWGSDREKNEWYGYSGWYDSIVE